MMISGNWLDYASHYLISRKREKLFNWEKVTFWNLEASFIFPLTHCDDSFFISLHWFACQPIENTPPKRFLSNEIDLAGVASLQRCLVRLPGGLQRRNFSQVSTKPNFIATDSKNKTVLQMTYISFRSKKRSSFLEQSVRKNWFAELLFRRTKNVYFYHFAHRSKMDPYGQVKTCFISIFDKTSNAFTSNWSIFNEFVRTGFTSNGKTLNWLFSWRCMWGRGGGDAHRKDITHVALRLLFCRHKVLNPSNRPLNLNDSNGAQYSLGSGWSLCLGFRSISQPNSSAS